MFGDVRNNLTKRLDDLSDRKLMVEENPGWEFLYSHYLYEAHRDFSTGEIAIRVPGGTVGTVFIDTSGIITKVAVSTDYVVSYNDDVNTTINKEFVGKLLELPKEET